LIVKKLISYDKYLEALKNVAGYLKLEEQGDNYILTLIGNDTRFITLLTEFDNDFPYVETDDQLRSITEIKKDVI